VLSVPFDMIAYYTGEPVRHAMGAVAKVVDERRGGSCVELNSAFGMLLRALGYQVEIIWGNIYRRAVLDRRPGHMALRVRAPIATTRQDDGAQAGASCPWLVDVAQGKHSRWPLRMDLRTPQADPHGTYLLAAAADGDIDVSVDGELLYRMEARARDEDYGEAVVWWLSTSPKSPFTRRPICIQPTENGKYSLIGNRFISEENGERVVKEIASDAELLEIYKRFFGLELAAPPTRGTGAHVVTPLFPECQLRLSRGAEEPR